MFVGFFLVFFFLPSTVFNVLCNSKMNVKGQRLKINQDPRSALSCLLQSVINMEKYFYYNFANEIMELDSKCKGI